MDGGKVYACALTIISYMIKLFVIEKQRLDITLRTNMILVGSSMKRFVSAIRSVRFRWDGNSRIRTDQMITGRMMHFGKS